MSLSAIVVDIVVGDMTSVRHKLVIGLSICLQLKSLEKSTWIRMRAGVKKVLKCEEICGNTWKFNKSIWTVRRVTLYRYLSSDTETQVSQLRKDQKIFARTVCACKLKYHCPYEVETELELNLLNRASPHTPVSCWILLYCERNRLNVNSRRVQNHLCCSFRSANIQRRSWTEMLRNLLFWATVFFGDFYRFWESNVHNVYVGLIELICLSFLFTVSDALASAGKCSLGKVSRPGALGEAWGTARKISK